MTLPPRYQYADEPIEINAGRPTLKITVRNTGDRAVQVGSDYHFFEVNSALDFDRDATIGMHLNIAAGTAVRFEPGGTHEVELCTYAGTGRLHGFSGLLNGSVRSQAACLEAVDRAERLGFRGARADGLKHEAGATGHKGADAGRTEAKKNKKGSH
ncbi:urease subunit beta [Streptomyces albidoflavus]|jgi:urease subunit beta|uniref:Urease subunit beta n=1 Tax=Streptomyces wadayamensis TaxID=141454 RepID=A0ABR4SHR2_9ACTN|nr:MULTISPECIES: urease subunit beta [Streptomyces]KDR64626.1 urease subunit beta [Streptomyces wadayamensis]MCO6694098.1 urease subunit beta [Streptomyces sp. Vc17.3-30]MCX4440158.1 urease subunit beta [Streptomyces albidoflavus]NEC94439.1 urease subunit beta [Streptomyces albidoflavus]QXQ27271.1 urease subunit beta [Streptomyces albidoflavus]